MPAQIFLSKGQVLAMAEIAEDGEAEGGFVVTEGPGGFAGQALDVWVMDEESLSSETHRSVVIDPEGSILGDERLGDNE